MRLRSVFGGLRFTPGPPIALRHGDIAEMDVPSLVSGLDVPTRVFVRADSTVDPATENTCAPNNDSNLCQKPVGASSLTLPIVLGVAIPVIGAITVLLYLHRRNIVRQRKEDAADPHKSLDFGLGDAPAGKGRRKSLFGGEKGGVRQRQLSMDLNMSTPYLLPPGLHNSRESLHSLSRTLHQNEDPYRPVAQYTNSDAGSIRSFKKGHEGSSVYTGTSSNRRDSGITGRSQLGQNKPFPPRQKSLPRSPPTSDPFLKETAPSMHEMSPRNSPSPPIAREQFHSPTEPAISGVEALPYPDDTFLSSHPTLPQIPDLREPPPVAQKISRKDVPGATSPRQQWDIPSVPEIGNMGLEHGGDDIPLQSLHSPQPAIVTGTQTSHDQQDRSFGLQDDFMQPPPRLAPALANSLPSSPRPQREPSPPALVPEPEPMAVPRIKEPHAQGEEELYHQQDYQQHYGEHAYEHHDFQGQGQQSYLQDDYPANEYYDEFEYDRRRSALRRSVDFQEAAQGLGVPHQDNKRLSVGFRPLPPDELMTSEDPEERANRIRSFYKEYFDESRLEHHNQVPLPTHRPQNQQVDYCEDYDQSYMADTAFFDSKTNAFVMPYAQPVTRRAMTPPPTASRFRGPPPPRGMHGSIGGMSLPGGRGPPRPGSSMSNRSNRWPGPPRPGSSISSRYDPRPGSSVSGRFGQPMNKRPRGPPPAALPTLPNPSKLRDDTFALMNAADFAPPDTFKERAAGRSQSPAGERRPYQLKVPVHSPLISAYEEMPAIPSPHLLRKSGTFTALDFAPPKRFKDNDTMSDAGSIRSNRSGISAVSQAAIRSGAGRVSRLPGDSVFTQAAGQQQLKPSWGMRD